MNIFCFFGFHKWRNIEWAARGPIKRKCFKCGRIEKSQIVFEKYTGERWRKV